MLPIGSLAAKAPRTAVRAPSNGVREDASMRILELWRYPVKSMLGERLDEVAVGACGIEGDRSFGLRDIETGIVLTARREPRLLFAHGIWRDGSATVRLPDGTETDDDETISTWLGRAVRLERAVEAREYEIALGDDGSEERFGAGDWVRWTGPTGSFHDSSRSQCSIVGTDTLRSWPVQRFRTNVVVEGGGEDALVGHRVALGAAELEVTKRIDRCVMVTRAQAGGIERDVEVLRTVNRERDTFLSVGAVVARPGVVKVGDELMELGQVGGTVT
jgi:uncharacterized protein